MLPAEKVRVVVFVGAVAAIYVLAASILIRLVLRRFGVKALPEGRGHAWVRRVVLALAGVGTLCVGYGFLVEPYRLEVTHVRIASPKLPAGSRPVRIVHVSDIHSDPKPRLEERLPDVVAGEGPDLIVFTGDAINSPGGLPVFRRCLTRLAAIAPVFAVRGNWDTRLWSDLDLFGGTGALELNGVVAKHEVRGIPLAIAGVPVGEEEHLGDVLGAIRPDEFGILLYHKPDEILHVAKRGVDLYCAGHTHGGQVALPVYGALVTLSRLGKRFEAGLYRVDRTWLYVNRGIGMEGGRAPRVRFWARPEVTVIDVEPEASR